VYPAESFCNSFSLANFTVQRFFPFVFVGHRGLKHRFQGRFPFIQIRTVFQPQLLQAVPVGLAEPFCGRGKEVLHVPSK
jgi:hypothetical protein